jgi:hypothetical protein
MRPGVVVVLWLLAVLAVVGASAVLVSAAGALMVRLEAVTGALRHAAEALEGLQIGSTARIQALLEEHLTKPKETPPPEPRRRR